jgi:hypothetical protein
VLVVAAGFVGYHRWRTSGFAWAEFTGAVAGMDWSWISAALAAVLATYVGRTLRWEIMLRPLTDKASLKRIFVATCIGFTAVVFFGRAGEPVRPFLISKAEGVSFSSQVAAWVVERILDLLMVLVVFGIALTQVGRSSVRPGPWFQTTLEAAGYTAGVTGLLCLTLLVALRQFRGRVRERLLEALEFLPGPVHARLKRFLTSFEEGMESTRNPVFIWKLVAYSLVEWAVIVVAFYCVFQAFPATTNLRMNDVVIALGFIVFGSALQIPGVGGGMQIAAALVLTQFFGITLEVASGISLVLWVVNFVSIVPVGLVLAFREGIKWRNLRKISSSEDYAV